MRTFLRPYPEYRDCGLPWLDRIPAHWQVRRNGYLFAQRNETGYEELPILEVSLNTGVRVRDFDGTARKQVMSDRGKYKRAAQGDIAYNMMRLWQGAVGVVPTDGLVSPAYVVARPYPGNESAFFVELFRTDACKAEINKYSRGIVSDRNRLYWDEFKQMPVCVPPTEEQVAILRYLDHADQNIRRFIQAKRRLIELLNEQRQAIINQAVTRGLAAGVPLKPSVIDRLGEVPEHWEEMPLGRLLSFGPKNGVSPPPGGQDSLGVTSFSIAAIRDGKFLLQGNEKQVSLDCSLISRFRVCPGDLLLVRGNGNVDYVARCGLVTDCPDDTVYPDIIIKIRPSDLMTAEFMTYAINSGYVRDQVACVAKTTNGAFKISGGTLSTLKLAVPPLAEQHELLLWISSSLSRLNDARQLASSHINLIREYRTRLIANVVTGKLDVREAAERHPSSSEQAALDDFLGLSALDPEDAEGLDNDTELLSVIADEE